VSFCHDLVLLFRGEKTLLYRRLLLNQPASLPTSTRVSAFFLFSFLVFMFSTGKDQQHRPEADVSHSLQILPVFFLDLRNVVFLDKAKT
jgi:hypothetical protein